MFKENIDSNNSQRVNTAEKIEIKNFKDDIAYQPDSSIIKMVLKKPNGNIMLFAFDKEQGLIEHSASSDAMVYIIEGEIQFTLAGVEYLLKEGDTLTLPAKIPHSLFAVKQTKMLLVILSD